MQVSQKYELLFFNKHKYFFTYEVYLNLFVNLKFS